MVHINVWVCANLAVVVDEERIIITIITRVKEQNTLQTLIKEYYTL